MADAMHSASLEGGFADRPVDAAHAFRTALRVLSRPGEVHRLEGARPPAPLSPAAGALLMTLADHETYLWLAPDLNTKDVRDWIAFHTGAPLGSRTQARFAIGAWPALMPITDFAIGTSEYPDRSATLIVEGGLTGARHTVTGPGIRTQASLPIPDAKAMRLNAALFPLGVDFFLTDGAEVAGLPRTTKILDAEGDA